MVFIAVNATLALSTGVRSGGDTGIYTSGAAALIAGEPLTARQPSYTGYIAFVAAFERLGLGAPGVIAGQIVAAAAAAAIVCMLGIEIGGVAAGALAVFLLAIDLETNRWHAYLLSDSLFMSALAIVTWLAHRASVVMTRAGYVIAVAGVVAAATIRPEGWFVIPAAIAYWLVRAPFGPRGRVVGLGAWLAGCAMLVAVVAPRLTGNVDAVGPGEMLRRGQTIWEYEGWRVEMPVDPESSAGRGSAMDAVAYAVRHPFGTATLMAARIAVHFAHVRPFFSTPHNVVILAWLVPVYALALRGVFAGRGRALTAWCLAVVGTQAAVVALTHADWDGRYLAHVMPLVYPFTACGALDLAHRWRGRTLDGVAVV